MGAWGLRAGGEKADVAEVAEGFVAGEVAGWGWGVGAGGGRCGVRGRDGGCGWGEGAGRGVWGLGCAGFAVDDGAEGIGDDAGGVEVGEHFRAEGVNDLGNLGGELFAFLAQLEEGVCAGGVEGEDERAEGFKDVHAGFAEAEGGEGDGGEEDEAEGNDKKEGHPVWHVPLDAVAVGPVGEKDGVVDVKERGEGESHEEFPGGYNVSAFELDR